MFWDRAFNGRWDYRVCFLNEIELREAIIDSGSDYVVVFDSQIVDDERWNNLCLVPKSCVEKIESSFEEVYNTSFGDISVYEVKGEN